MPFNRTCPRCGAACARQRMYCSSACANAAKTRRITLACQACGAPFSVKRSEAAKGRDKHCSQGCYDRSRTMPPASCKQCGQQFPTTPSRARKHAAYCSRECYIASRVGTKKPVSTRVERQCSGCGAAFTVYPSQLKYGVGLWCSPSCRYATPGWSSVLHPGHRKSAICVVCGACFERVSSAKAVTCSRRCNGVRNGQRQERDPSKRTTKTCVECGKAFEALICLGDRRKFCSRVCNGIASARRLRVLRPTSIEVALRRGLTEAGIATVPEMRIGRFLIDMAIPAAQIAIEADGTYWHSLPNRIAADARKNAALAATGWTVLRFSEDEINADVASCVAVVLEALRARSG